MIARPLLKMNLLNQCGWPVHKDTTSVILLCSDFTRVIRSQPWLGIIVAYIFCKKLLDRVRFTLAWSAVPPIPSGWGAFCHLDRFKAELLRGVFGFLLVTFCSLLAKDGISLLFKLATARSSWLLDRPVLTRGREGEDGRLELEFFFSVPALESCWNNAPKDMESRFFLIFLGELDREFKSMDVGESEVGDLVGEDWVELAQDEFPDG